LDKPAVRPKRKERAAVAKQRLQMVLIHDRSDVSPGVIEQIKDEIIEVIARRLSIDSEHVVMNLTQTGRESCLVAEIPLQTAVPAAPRRGDPCGRTGAGTRPAPTTSSSRRI
jgi:cell division topological specificity factor